METKDLGTYHVKIELVNGDGWINEVHTGWRFTHGTGNTTKLTAQKISPGFTDEEDLINTMLYMYMYGNYSCDCNKKLFLAWAHQQPEDHLDNCGHTLAIKRITLLTPQMDEKIIWEEYHGED